MFSRRVRETVRSLGFSHVRRLSRRRMCLPLRVRRSISILLGFRFVETLGTRTAHAVVFGLFDWLVNENYFFILPRENHYVIQYSGPRTNDREYGEAIRNRILIQNNECFNYSLTLKDSRESIFDVPSTTKPSIS